MKFKEYLTEATKRKKVFKKYVVQGNSFKPVGDVVTEKTIPAGVYRIEQDMNGAYFEVHDISTDEILKFEDARYNQVLNEIKDFWGLKKSFEKFGFTHKRGILLYGEPGTGKSCLLKLAIENTIKDGNVVLLTKNARVLVDGLQKIREVEPNRKLLVVIEDIDEVVRYGEHAILELFDGDSQTDNVLFLATTNYLNRLPPRILRASRFDRKIEVGTPPSEGRQAYLEHKLRDSESTERIAELVDKTDGFTFAQLKEFTVATFCLKQDEDEVINRLKTNVETHLRETQTFKDFLEERISEDV